jgi:NAD(P)H-dependent FMN reductase
VPNEADANEEPSGKAHLKLKVLVGSTRPTRAADKVLPWVVRRAEGHGAFDVDVLDLREWNLPIFAEHFGTIGDISDPTYSEPVVKAWNRTMVEADCLLVVTPEYLHSIPGVLKNALDSVFVSFALRNKPIAAVGYSGGVAAGVRAIEHLSHMAIEAEMAPVRNTVLIPFVGEAFGDDGNPIDRRSEVAMTIMLDDLEWWARALAAARAVGELAPGTFRMRAASQA